MKVIFLVGQTATGKTELSLEIAKKYKGEIICADSRQIYKGLIIGAASPALDDPKALELLKKNGKLERVLGIPHHLFHFLSPKRQYSAALFKRRALKIIRDVWKRGRLPVVVGGTGLYISALIDNLVFPRVAPNQELREYLEKKDTEFLFQVYKTLDPVGAEFIDKDNKRRVVRAIEVCLVTKKPFWEQRRKGPPLFESLQIGLRKSTTVLEGRIKKRTEKMIKLGLIEEVESLVKRYGWEAPALDGIGYKEFRGYFEGKKPLTEVKKDIIRNTLRYARYQRRWFKKDKRIFWIRSKPQALRLVEKFLNKRD